MNKTTWILIFLFVLFVHLGAIYLHYESIQFITKACLMPILILYVVSQTQSIKAGLKTWLVLAQIFSWIGDILLMFEENASIFFLLGLSAFLVAQVLYIVFFHNIRVREGIPGNALFLLVVVVYYSILVSVLSPHLGNMTLPVRVYGVLLSFMLMLAMHTTIGRIKKAGYWMMTGAILFVTSDSLLAFNKFYTSFVFAGEVIMFTYGLAQLLIAYGAVKYLNMGKRK